ncbi:MAG: M48 family metallopeptidase [Draconibacterium sp.]|nr:M48 family metallopeptidase [Draconibacterium sp.]
MSGKVVQFKNIGIVTFSKNRRSKNIKISVKPDKSVLVSFPFYCSSEEVLAFVQNNEEWIWQQQRKMESRRSKIDINSEIKTKLHSVVFILGEDYNIETKNDVIRIIVPDLNSDKSHDYIENILIQIYRFEAKKILPGKLAELAEKHGFKYQRVTIRNNKRNWGSCSSKNNISLNLQMMKLPDELIEYILLHELIHTKIKNHGAKFWEQLNEVTGNRARELAKQVKQYSTYTL